MLRSRATSVDASASWAQSERGGKDWHCDVPRLSPAGPSDQLSLWSGFPLGSAQLGDKAAPLHLYMSECTGDSYNPAPMPSFDASVTFQWTVRSKTPTTSFN